MEMLTRMLARFLNTAIPAVSHTVSVLVLRDFTRRFNAGAWMVRHPYPPRQALIHRRKAGLLRKHESAIKHILLQRIFINPVVQAERIAMISVREVLAPGSELTALPNFQV